MNSFKKTLIAASLLVAPVLAHAEISANVALTTDYVWRGMSQSNEDPAVSGGFDYAHDSGLYAGIWGSSIDFGTSSTMELDYYAGFSGEFGDGIGYDVGVIYYDYPGTDNPDPDFNFLEVYGSLSYSFLTFAVNYSSDVYNSDETGVYYNLSGEYELGDFTLAAGVGYYDYDAGAVSADDESVVDYHLGVSTSQLGVDWDLSYFDTDSDGEQLFGDIADSRVVLTASKSF